MASALLMGVVVLYLLGMIGIGYYYRDRAATESGFLVADRSIGPIIGGGALAITFISTSSLLGAVSMSYQSGILWALFGGLGGVFTYFVAMYVLAPQLRAMESETLPQYFETQFGQYTKNTSALIIALIMTVYLIAQVQGGALVATNVFSIDFPTAVVLVGAIFVIYTALGGMYAITLTSFIQATVLLFSVIVVAVASLWRIGGWTSLLNQVQSTAPFYFTNAGRIGIEFAFGFGALVFLAGLCSPHVLFRYFASSNSEVAKDTAGIAAIFQGIFFTILVIPPAAAILLVPNLSNPDQAFLAVANSLLEGNPLLLGLIFAGILAAAMSTADAMLMNAASSIVHDLAKDYVNFNENRATLYTRIVTIIIGVIVVGLTISPPGLILTIAILALSLFIGAFLTPVMTGLYLETQSDVAGAAAMVSGVITVIVTHPDTPIVQLSQQAFAGIFGVIISFIIFIAVNYVSTGTTPTMDPIDQD